MTLFDEYYNLYTEFPDESLKMRVETNYFYNTVWANPNIKIRIHVIKQILLERKFCILIIPNTVIFDIMKYA